MSDGVDVILLDADPGIGRKLRAGAAHGKTPPGPREPLKE